MPDCPTLLSTLLGFEPPDAWNGSVNVLVQLAVSMRAHRRGGLLIVVPPGTDSWRESIVQPIAYAVSPAFSELAYLLESGRDGRPGPQWQDSLRPRGRCRRRADGRGRRNADDLRLRGPRVRREDRPPPRAAAGRADDGDRAHRGEHTRRRSTRRRSAARGICRRRSSSTISATRWRSSRAQDGRFTVFAWSPCIDMVHAHRVETLLL